MRDETKLSPLAQRLLSDIRAGKVLTRNVYYFDELDTDVWYELDDGYPPEYNDAHHLTQLNKFVWEIEDDYLDWQEVSKHVDRAVLKVVKK